MDFVKHHNLGISHKILHLLNGGQYDHIHLN